MTDDKEADKHKVILTVTLVSVTLSLNEKRTIMVAAATRKTLQSHAGAQPAYREVSLKDRRSTDVVLIRLIGPPARPRPADMWTEVTKDLVLKEAIDAYGFDYEETPEYFYVMEYLRYVSL